MKRILILLFVLLLSTPAYAGGNTTIDSFSTAKRMLLYWIYPPHRITFYCECEFGKDGDIVNRRGYLPRTDNARADRIEWEHVVPAAKFGRTFKAWTDGHPKCVDSSGEPYKGRRCANKVSYAYRLIQADMYNLYPAVGEINGLRSNYPYTIIPGEERLFGTCDFEIKDGMVEPRPGIRGDIARTYFYMQWAYPDRVKLKRKVALRLIAWHKSDPIDAWELARAKHIEKIQHNTNPFVMGRKEEACANCIRGTK